MTPEENDRDFAEWLDKMRVLLRDLRVRAGLRNWSRDLLIIAAVLWLIAVGLSKCAHAQASDTRWRLRVHVFYDDGLKFEESRVTFREKARCDRAGDEKEAWFARRRIRASSLCVPVHTILDLGKVYT